MNKIILMGRLTRDPEVRYYGADNKALANFSLAVDRRFKKQGQPEADFFRCSAFGKNAETIEKYCHKGTKLLIDGEMQNNDYEKDGVKHYGFQVIVNSFEFCESKKSQSQNNAGGDYSPASDQGDGDFVNIPQDAEDSLPFA